MPCLCLLYIRTTGRQVARSENSLQILLPPNGQAESRVSDLVAECDQRMWREIEWEREREREETYRGRVDGEHVHALCLAYKRDGTENDECGGQDEIQPRHGVAGVVYVAC